MQIKMSQLIKQNANLNNESDSSDGQNLLERQLAELEAKRRRYLRKPPEIPQILKLAVVELTDDEVLHELRQNIYSRVRFKLRADIL